jgi:hypothetical protein
MVKGLSVILGIYLFLAPSISPALDITGFRGIAIEGGINVANLSGSQLGDTESRKGLCLGAYVEFMSINSVLHVQGEALYMAKGTRELLCCDEADGWDVAMNYRLDYVEFPLVIRLDVPRKWTRIDAYLVTGFSFALQTDAKVEMQVRTSGDSREVAFGSLREHDYGVIAGVGFSALTMEDGDRFCLEVRYDWGLSRLDPVFDARNRVVSLLCVYRPNW